MQKIGIGYENYKEFIDGDMYYIDKTLLIRDIVEKGGKVTLFTRPRRFGKTLALSMLRTFFELEYDFDGNTVDNSRYFDGKKIMEAEDKILSMKGQYPVVNLSLKSAKQPDFRTSFLKLRSEIVREFRRHSYLKESQILSDEDKQEFGRYAAFMDETEIDSAEKLQAEVSRFAIALRDLSGYLKKHHNKNVIILLDEYDVPLENSYYAGFYDEMIAFIRSLFESALKTNDNLEFAVITGCLRISKESIFTGMNNLKINSIRDVGFSEGFGFTPAETKKMLEDYGIGDRTEEVKEWYNGYIFGEDEIYNPWSVISYVYSKVIDKRQFPEPYWANTSSNQIIKDMVQNADETIKSELDTLISGGTIEKKSEKPRCFYFSRNACCYSHYADGLIRSCNRYPSCTASI